MWKFLRRSQRPAAIIPSLHQHGKRYFGEQKSIAALLHGIFNDCRSAVRADKIRHCVSNFTEAFHQKSTTEVVSELCLEGYINRTMAYEFFDIVDQEGYSLLIEQFIRKEDSQSAIDVFIHTKVRKIGVSATTQENLAQLCSKHGDVQALKKMLELYRDSKSEVPENVVFRCIVPLIMCGETKFLKPFVTNLIRRTSIEDNLGRIYIAFCFGKFRRILGSCQGNIGRTDIDAINNLGNEIARNIVRKTSISRFHLRESCIAYLYSLPAVSATNTDHPLSFYNFPYMMAGKLPSEIGAKDIDRSHRLLYAESLFTDEFLCLRRQAEMNVFVDVERQSENYLSTTVPVSNSKEHATFNYVKRWLDRELLHLLKDDDGYVAHCLMAEDLEEDVDFGLIGEGDDGMDDYDYDKDLQNVSRLSFL